MENNSERKPVVAMTYGPPKCGKTTDLGFSFPRALFIAAPGALTCVEKACGYQPVQVYAQTIFQATEIVKREGQKGAFNDVVIDDLSFLAEQTFSELEKTKKGFKLWGALRDAMLEFRNAARFSGVNVIFNAWESNPTTTEKGDFRRGGPQLSGSLREAVPALCDVVLRAVHDTRAKPWPVVYHCNADPNYVMGDRFDVAGAISPAPLNLGEILRASGLHIDRLWPEQEAEVAQIAAALMEKEKAEWPATANEVYKALLGAYGFHRARWTVRDATDRALIQTDLAARVQTYYAASPGGLI